MNDEIKKGIGEFLKQQNDFTQASGRISTALPYNLGAAPTEPSLFDSLTDQDVQLLNASDVSYVIDRNNRRVVITEIERRVIYVLGVYLSQYLEEKNLYDNLIEDDLNRVLSKIDFTFNIKEIANIIFHRSKSKQVEEIRNAFISLYGKLQVIELVTKDKKDKMTYVGPFIKIERMWSVQSSRLPDDDDFEKFEVTITYGQPFFWNFKNRYAYFPVRLFEIWKKKGSGTDSNLFDILLDTLLYHKWHCMLAYKTAKSELDKELKDKGQKLPKEEYDKLLYKRREAALTYKESLSSLLSRVDTKYREHRRVSRMKNTLMSAVTALKGKNVNLITNFKMEETNMDTYLYFRYNPESFNRNKLIDLKEQKQEDSSIQENKDEDNSEEI